MSKIHIATNREIGEKCRIWAKENIPRGWEYSDNPDDCDVYISILSLVLLNNEFIKSKRNCFNFHPAILPKYRGSGLCSWVLINEEKEMGTTLHLINGGIDTGDIIKIEKFPIEETDTAETLFHKCEDTIFKMFQEWFDKLLRGDFVARKQPHKGSFYTRHKLEKAKDLTRFVKAFTFSGKESAYYKKNGVKEYL